MKTRLSKRGSECIDHHVNSVQCLTKYVLRVVHYRTEAFLMIL